jgi:hypothetical protein
MEASMHLDLAALAGLVLAAIVMLLVTQTKQRVSWPGWIVPAAFAAVAAGWTVLAVVTQGADALWPLLAGSPWGIQLWYDRLFAVTAAFFLLQNRARAVGMKSEVWVLMVIFTGSIGLLLMLARTLYIERRQTAA